MRTPILHAFTCDSFAGCRAAVREYSPDLGEKHRTWVFVIFSHETRSSPARRNLMSEYPNLSISLIRPSIRRVVQKKSEQLMSGGCFREILRFLDVARTRAGSSEAWNIKDFMLLTVLGDGDRFSKNRGKGLRGEIFRCSSRFLDGIGRIGEILRFRPAVTWRASPQSTSRQRVARSATWPCAPRPSTTRTSARLVWSQAAEHPQKDGGSGARFAYGESIDERQVSAC